MYVQVVQPAHDWENVGFGRSQKSAAGSVIIRAELAAWVCDVTLPCIAEPPGSVGAGDGLVVEDVFSGLEVEMVVVGAALAQLARILRGESAYTKL
jgi:hypothetical protein